MKIDFHTHGKLAKKLPFSGAYTSWLLTEAKTAGLDAICLTEHFNTIGFQEIYQYLENHYEKEGDCYVTDQGLKLFPGMETDIAEGGHVLSIGPSDQILELNQRLEPYKEKGNFLPFETLSRYFDSYDLLVGAGHPYREGGHIPELSDHLIRKFDFFDLNGKDIAEDEAGTKEKVYALAGKFDKKVAAGSDTHQSFQYGCIYNVFEKECVTVKEIREQIEKEAYEIRISQMASFQVKTAGLLKKSLKEINALGGEYVTLLVKGA